MGVRQQFGGHFWHISKLVDLVLYCSFMSYCILFWGPSTVSRAFLVFIKTHGFGPFSQLYELLYTALGSVDSLRAFLAFIKTRAFGPFSQLYELLHTVLGSVDSFEGISGIYQNSWIGHFSQLYELLHIVLGSVDSFEGISGIYP